jgi:hypothetical protein
MFRLEQRTGAARCMFGLRNNSETDQRSPAMTRTVFAIAAALFAATTFSSGASACISCEYVPPVVNTPVYSHGASHYKRKSSHAAASVRRARAKLRLQAQAKARAQALARAEAKAEARAKALAKAKAQAKIETAKATPVDADVENENSAISTASVDKSDAETVELTPSDEPQVSKAVGCKKFFPTVGMTLTVPCE